MKPITYKYKNFDITIYDFQGDNHINVTCSLEGKSFNRAYEVKQEVESIVIDEEYVYLNDGDENQFVIKFEGESCLIIDTFDNRGEHLEVIGCHDFYDDV